MKNYKLAIYTDAESNDFFSTLVATTERELFILENVGGVDTKSGDFDAVFTCYDDIFKAAEAEQKSSIIFAPNFAQDAETIAAQFQNLNALIECPDAPTSRCFSFLDKYISWTRNSETQGTTIYISEPQKMALLAESGADIVREFGENLRQVMQNSKTELLQWFVDNFNKSIKNEAEQRAVINDIWGCFSIPIQNSILSKIRREPQKYTQLNEIGLTADYLAELGKHGKNGTKTALMKQAEKMLQTAINDNDIKAVGDVVENLEKVQRYNTNAQIIESLNKSHYDHANEMQSGEDIETEWQLYFDGKDGNAAELRKLTFSNCGVSVVVAPTKHGKTTFLIDTAIRHAQAHPNETILYFSIEENEQQIVTKIYRWFADGLPFADELTRGDGALINIRRWRTSGADVDKFNELQKMADAVQNFKPLRLNTDIDTAAAQIKAVLQYEREHGRSVGAVFLDYIQLLRKQKSSYSRTDEMSYVCNALNDLSKSENVGIITGAQFNRQAKEAKSLDDWGVWMIGESQSIENISTDVYLLANTAMCKEIAYKNDTTRGARIFANSTPTDENGAFFYIENLISREHRGGGWCVLPVNLNFGKIEQQQQGNIFNNSNIWE